MRLIRRVLFGLLAFLFGESLALFKKDKQFKSKFSKADVAEKMSLLFKELFDFNKEIVDDVKKIDYAGSVEEFKERFVEELSHLEEHLSDLTKKALKIGGAKYQALLKVAEHKLQGMKKQLLEGRENVNEKYEIENKIVQLIEKISLMKKQLIK